MQHTKGYWYVAYDKRYIGQTLGGPTFGEYIPYYSQMTLGLEFHKQPDARSAWKVFATYADRTSDISPVQDAQVSTAGGSYTFALNDNIVLALSGLVQDTQSDSADAAATSGSLNAGMSLALETMPITLSGNLGTTHTEYKTLLGGYSDLRMDDAVNLELALTHDDIQFYGFNPTFGINLVRNYSNFNRHDTQTVAFFTRLNTSF